MLGGAAVPRDRFGGILRHADALGVYHPEVVLRARVALLGGAAVPRDRFGGILRHADAGDIHAAEDELRLGVARLGAGTEVREGLCGWAVFILCLNTGREGGDHEGDTHNVATYCVYSKALADGHSTRRSCDGGAGQLGRSGVGDPDADGGAGSPGEARVEPGPGAGGLGGVGEGEGGAADNDGEGVGGVGDIGVDSEREGGGV